MFRDSSTELLVSEYLELITTRRVIEHRDSRRTSYSSLTLAAKYIVCTASRFPVPNCETIYVNQSNINVFYCITLVLLIRSFTSIPQMMRSHLSASLGSWSRDESGLPKEAGHWGIISTKPWAETVSEELLDPYGKLHSWEVTRALDSSPKNVRSSDESPTKSCTWTHSLSKVISKRSLGTLRSRCSLVLEHLS